MKKILLRCSALMVAAFVLLGSVLLAVPVKVSAAETEYTVSGVWEFNGNLYDSFPSQSVLFFSNGMSFSSLELKYVLGTGSLLYFGDQVVYRSTQWVNIAYSTIDFGETEQVVSEEFYTWLNANATFQAPPPDPGPLVEVMTELKEQNLLTQVLMPLMTIIPIGLVCLVGYKGLRKALDLLRGILHQA